MPRTPGPGSADRSALPLGTQGKKDKKGKKRKDPTADRSIESLFAELVSNGLIKPCPKTHVQDYLGLPHLLGFQLQQQQQGDPGDPSMPQVRQLVSEYCILPLGSTNVHEKAPFQKAVLLYGPKASAPAPFPPAITGGADLLCYLTPLADLEVVGTGGWPHGCPDDDQPPGCALRERPQWGNAGPWAWPVHTQRAESNASPCPSLPHSPLPT